MKQSLKVIKGSRQMFWTYDDPQEVMEAYKNWNFEDHRLFWMFAYLKDGGELWIEDEPARLA